MWREDLEKEFNTTFMNRSITGLMMVIPFFSLIYFANSFLTNIVITVISILIFFRVERVSQRKKSNS